MKKRNLSDDEKELWQEFSKTAEPLFHQSQNTQKAKPEEKKRVNAKHPTITIPNSLIVLPPVV